MVQCCILFGTQVLAEMPLIRPCGRRERISLSRRREARISLSRKRERGGVRGFAEGTRPGRAGHHDQEHDSMHRRTHRTSQQPRRRVRRTTLAPWLIWFANFGLSLAAADRALAPQQPEH